MKNRFRAQYILVALVLTALLAFQNCLSQPGQSGAPSTALTPPSAPDAPAPTSNMSSGGGGNGDAYDKTIYVVLTAY